MTASRPPSLPRAARHWRCGCGRTPSRLADTTHDADARPDYPGGLTILMGGHRYRTGDQPGQVMRHGHRDKAKIGRLNRSTDMLVLLSWEQSTQHCRHPRGTAI